MSRLPADVVNRQSVAGLWLLADHFESTDPAKSILFLKASLKADLSEADEARTRVKVAQLLLQHTLNIDDAREHLNRALILSSAVRLKISPSKDAGLAQVKLQTLYLFHIADSKDGNIKNMRSKLERGIDASAAFPEWRGVFLIKTAQAACLESDFDAAATCLRQGVLTADQAKLYKHSIIFRLAMAQLHLQRRELKHVSNLIDKSEKILTRIIERETAAADRPRLISASTTGGLNRSVNLSLEYEYDDSDRDDDGDDSPIDENKMDVDAAAPPKSTSPRRNFHQTSLEMNSIELYLVLLRALYSIRTGNIKTIDDPSTICRLESLSETVVAQFERKEDPGCFTWMHPSLMAALAQLVLSICHQHIGYNDKALMDLAEGFEAVEDKFLMAFSEGDDMQVSRDLMGSAKSALQIKFALLQSAFFMRLGSTSLETAAKTLMESLSVFEQFGGSMASTQHGGGAREAVGLNFMAASLFLSMDMLQEAQRHLESCVEFGKSLAKAEGFDRHLMAALLLCFVYIRRNRTDRAASILSGFGKILIQHSDALIRCMYHSLDALLRFTMQQASETKEKLQKAMALLKQTVRNRTITTFVCTMSALSGVQFDGHTQQAHIDLVTDCLKVSSRAGDVLSTQHVSSILALLYQTQGDVSNQAMQISQATLQNKILQEKRDAASKHVAEIAEKCQIILSDGQKNKLLRQKQTVVPETVR